MGKLPFTRRELQTGLFVAPFDLTRSRNLQPDIIDVDRNTAATIQVKGKFKTPPTEDFVLFMMFTTSAELTIDHLDQVHINLL